MGALLALLVLFRLAVPAGWMIAPAGAGGPGLVLCESAAPAPAGHHRHEPLPAKHKSGLCPFASLASPTLPLTPPLVGIPAGPAEPAPAVPPPAGYAPSPAAPPPPATGPPLPV
jgi:DUF2946 family protein